MRRPIMMYLPCAHDAGWVLREVRGLTLLWFSAAFCHSTGGHDALKGGHYWGHGRGEQELAAGLAQTGMIHAFMPEVGGASGASPVHVRDSKQVSRHACVKLGASEVLIAWHVWITRENPEWHTRTRTRTHARARARTQGARERAQQRDALPRRADSFPQAPLLLPPLRVRAHQSAPRV